MADETVKKLEELRKIEAERLELEKKKFEEAAKDREKRLDKKGFEDLVKELRKDRNLAKSARNLTDQRLDTLIKGPVANIAQAAKKNTELQTAIFNQSKSSQLQAVAIAVERNKVDQNENSFRGQSQKIVATLAARFLDSTQIGQVILGRAIDEQSLTRKGVDAITRNALSDGGALRTEFGKMRQGFVDKLDGLKQRLETFKDGFKKFTLFFTDPLGFVKMVGGALWKFVIKRLLFFGGKLLLGALKLPFKAMDKLVGFLRGRGGKEFKLRQVENRREAARKRGGDGKISGLLGSMKRLFGKGGTFGLISVAAKGLGSLAKGAAGGILGGLGSAGGLFGLKKLFGGKGGVAGAVTKGSKLAKVGRFAGRVVLPLTAIIAGVAGGFKEFKKTGDIQKAIGEGLTEAAGILTFGLVKKEELRKKIKDPFLAIVTGLNDMIDGNFSKENLDKTFSGAAKLVAAPFDAAFKMGTGLVAASARLFGADDFAAKVDSAFKDVNFGETILKTVDTLAKVFTNRAAAENFVGAAKTIDDERFADIEDEDSLLGTIKALQTGIAGATMQIQSTTGEAQDKSIAQQEALRTSLKAALDQLAALRAKETAIKQGEQGELDEAGKQLAALRAKETAIKQGELDEAGKRLVATKQQTESLTDLMLDPNVTDGANLARQVATNATLRSKAAKPVIIAPQPAPVIVEAPPAQIMTIPLTISQRNNENTIRRIADNNARGSMPR